MAEPGKIFWSALAGRFYQEGRSGCVSREEALRVARYNAEAGRFIDQKGRFIPMAVAALPAVQERQLIAHDAENRPFLSTLIRTETVSDTAAGALRLAGNQEMLIRDIITLPDGKVITVYTSTTIGSRMSKKTLDEMADRRVAGKVQELTGRKSGAFQKKDLQSLLPDRHYPETGQHSLRGYLIMSYAQFFTCLKREYKTRNVAAFDTEGIGGEGNFLCGSVVSSRETCFFTERGDMLKYLSSGDFANELIAAHNLEYDLSLLTGGHLADWELLYIDSRLLQARRHDTSRHTWTLIDSRNLFSGFSVEQLGQIVATPKLALPAPLTYKIRHGVHWVDLDMIEQNEVRQYNLRDSLIVYRALVWLQDELNALGGQLQSTIAGCAMDLFRRKHLTTSWRTPDRAVNNFYRAAYYGAALSQSKLVHSWG